MKGGDIVNKAEIALELTKIISANILHEEKSNNPSDFPKALGDAYNKIYETINITEK